MKEENVSCSLDYESMYHECLQKSKCIEAENIDLREANRRLNTEIESVRLVNNELLEKVKFLEGQVDAYQYCIGAIG